MIFAIVSFSWLVTLPAWYTWGWLWENWNKSIKGSLRRVQYAKRTRLMLLPAALHLLSFTAIAICLALQHQYIGFSFSVLVSAVSWTLYLYQARKFLKEDDWFTKQKSKLKRWLRNSFTVRQVAPIRGR